MGIELSPRINDHGFRKKRDSSCLAFLGVWILFGCILLCPSIICVGRTHTIFRLETRIRRKDGTENFGGLVYVLDGFPQRDFVLWVLMCPINFILYFLICLLSCLFSGYHAKGYHAPSILHGLSRPGLSRLYHHCTATTPVYICPGYHAIVLSPIPGLSHLSYHAPPHTYIGLSHPP